MGSAPFLYCSSVGSTAQLRRGRSHWRTAPDRRRSSGEAGLIGGQRLIASAPPARQSFPGASESRTFSLVH